MMEMNNAAIFQILAAQEEELRRQRQQQTEQDLKELSQNTAFLTDMANVSTNVSSVLSPTTSVGGTIQGINGTFPSDPFSGSLPLENKILSVNDFPVLRTPDDLLADMNKMDWNQFQNQKALLKGTTSDTSQSQLKPIDPTNYSNYAPAYTVPPIITGGHSNTLKNQMIDPNRGLVDQTMYDLMDYNPMGMSKEASQEYFAQQSRSIQERAMNSLSSGVQGLATAGGFLMPGGFLTSLAAGAAVGATVNYVTNSMVDETRVALDYQDILRREAYKFINTFESTSEFGGIGLSLENTQEMSKFLRDLSPEKFLEDKDIQAILQGSLDNKLLKSVTDVESFKKKFTSLVDAVKEITVTMDQSIEEATKFMGEMERRGIKDKDMTFIAAQTKVASSMLGIDASEGAQRILSTADTITQGTSLNANNIVQSASESMFRVAQLYDWSKINDPEMEQYIKNNGGTTEVGSQVEQRFRGYVNNNVDKLMGFFAAGVKQVGEDFVIDEGRMNDLLTGDYSLHEMNQMSTEVLNGLDLTDRAKMYGQIGKAFQNFSGNPEMMQLVSRMQEAIVDEAAGRGQRIDEQTALVNMGIAGDYEQAKFIQELLKQSNDPNLSMSFHARSLKEAMDSTVIANTPGLGKQFDFWWERNIRNPLGDVGQGVTDAIGSQIQDYQKYITGISDRQVVGSNKIYELTLEELNQEMNGEDGSVQQINEFLTERAETVRENNKGKFDWNVLSFDSNMMFADSRADTIESGKIDTLTESRLFSSDDSQFSQNTFDYLLGKIDTGGLNGTDIYNLQTKIQSGQLEGADLHRAQYILNKATGVYTGLGSIDQMPDRFLVAFDNVTNDALSFFKEDVQGEWDEAIGKGTGNTLEALQQSEAELKSQFEDLQKERMNLFKSGDLGTTEIQKLEGFITAGDVAGVRSLTSNQEAIQLAEKYDQTRKVSMEQKKSMDKLTGITQGTEVVARVNTQLEEFFSLAGISSDAYLLPLFDDLKGSGDEALEKMKEGDMSVNEMYRFREDSLKSIDEIFSNITEEDLSKIATTLADKNLAKITDMETMDGTLDEEKVKSQLLKSLSVMHADLSPKKEWGEEEEVDFDDLKSTADGNVRTMYEMIKVFQEQTRMMKEYIEGLPVKSPSKTSVTSKSSGGILSIFGM